MQCEVTGGTPAPAGNYLDFAFRGYDSRIGRFISPDPLHKKYPWNGDYTFAEDRVIDGADLEGREWRSTTSDNVTKLTVTVTVVNESKVYNKEAVGYLLQDLKPAFEKEFTKETPTHKYMTTIVFQTPEEHTANGGGKSLTLYLRDQYAEGTGANGTEMTYAGEIATLATITNQASQSGYLVGYVSLNGEKRKKSDIVNNINHGLGHTGGITHPWEEKNQSLDVFQPNVKKKKEIPNEKQDLIINNLMNSDANPIIGLSNTHGSDVTEGQMEQITNIVEKVQPSLNTGNGTASPQQYTSPQTPSKQ